MPLTDIALRKAKAQDRPQRLSDEKGLYILLQPSGAKWWRLDFRLGGARHTMSIGTYPEVDLAAARVERDRIRKLVSAGIDPVHARKKTSDDDHRFEIVARRWIDAQRQRWDPKHAATILRRLKENAFPFIGQRDIRTIDTGDLLDIARRMESRGVFESSSRMNAHCGKIFRFAIAEGLAARDPSHDIKDALTPKPPVKHRAALSAAQMPRFLVQLADDVDEEIDTRDAMKLTILTAVRTVEARFATVDEFEDIDGPAPLWRLPAERMKMRLPHLVPLSTQAAALVRRRIAMLRPGQKLLFERRTRSGVISENTMLYGLYRLGYRGRATMHGFRRVFSTLANEAGKNRDHIERQLAHVEGSGVRAAYNSAEYLPERRKLLQWWADWLDAQEAAGRREIDIDALIG